MKLSIVGKPGVNMSTRYKNTFRCQVLDFVRQFDGEVLLRSDFNALGTPRQVSRALKALIEDGELIRFGYGVYEKAEYSDYLDRGILKVTLAEVAITAFKRLGVSWELGKALQDYNAGKTQQVPVKFIVRLKNRFRRQLGVLKRKVVFEGGINAK